MPFRKDQVFNSVAIGRNATSDEDFLINIYITHTYCKTVTGHQYFNITYSHICTFYPLKLKGYISLSDIAFQFRKDQVFNLVAIGRNAISEEDFLINI